MGTAEEAQAVLECIFHPHLPFGGTAAAGEEEEQPPLPLQEEGAFAPELLEEAAELEAQGIAAAEAGDTEAALERFGRAIRLLPARPSAYNNRAQARRLQGDVAGAAEPEAEGRAFSCLAAVPSLAWYLDGETNGSSTPAATLEEGGEGGGSSSSGTFVVTARRLDRRLNCSAVDLASGHVASASVALHVQFKPELVQVEARSEEGGQPGLLLVLFVLVQASPPANITWVDQDGRLMVNTSHFLIVDAKTYPWLANHTLEVQLRGWTHNSSLGASSKAGVLNASLLLPGLLDARVELPLLALLIGATGALGLLMGLGALVSYLGYQKGKKAAGLAPPAQVPPSDSNLLKWQGPRLPRANMSLPSNLQLNDFTLEPQAKVTAQGAEDEEAALSEPENSLALANRGLGHFPMVGYIYRASSGSSEEIWL